MRWGGKKGEVGDLGRPVGSGPRDWKRRRQEQTPRVRGEGTIKRRRNRGDGERKGGVGAEGPGGWGRPRRT